MWEDFVYHVEQKDTKKSNEMYYPRDDNMFSMIKLVSRHQNTLQFGALLPIEVTNDDIRNYNAYKEYYAVATRVTPHKPKASVRKTRSSFDTTVTPPTAAVAMIEAQQLKLATKRSLQQTHISQASGSGVDEGTVQDDDDDEGNDEDNEEEGSDDEQASDEEEFIHLSLSTHAGEETMDEESFDHILKTPKNSDDEGNDEENQGTNVGRDEGQDKEDEPDELYRDVNINLGRGIQLGDVHTTQEVEDSHVTLTPSDRLRDEGQADNDEFLKTIDENMQKIIKEQVKEQVKILIEKMEGNKSIQRSNEQMNLYKALFEAYESDKIILDTYEDIVMLKRRRDDDADRDEEPSVGSDRGSKRRREGMEPESATEEPMQTTSEMEEPSHPEFETGADDQPIVQSSQHPEWFAQQQKPPTPDRDWNKTLPATHGSIQPWISKLTKQSDSRSSFNELMDTPRRIIAVTELKIVEWHNYKNLDWITMQRDNDKLYKFKEGNFKRLRIQDIEDMLLLLVQEKLTNLTVEERFAFNVSLRMFTRSIIIQRCVEDLQLDRKEAYIAYSNPRGFIYQNKDKQNRLMQIDELHKFSDGTLIDVRTALDDRLKGIGMKYLLQSIWRKSDKDRAAAMIRAIDKRLKTRRIMRSLERFVGGRLYEGDFRMLQRTI
nr:hypothetical protein [Tanacetum cinerariifolium]